jgi:hypothetical protein
MPEKKPAVTAAIKEKKTKAMTAQRLIELLKEGNVHTQSEIHVYSRDVFGLPVRVKALSVRVTFRGRGHTDLVEILT